MGKVKFKGAEVALSGVFPLKGRAKNFHLTGGDLAEVTLETFQGKKKILNIVPSLDTPVCATSSRKFNEKAGRAPNSVVLVVSADLPFAQKRFCETEGLKNVVPVSCFRSTFAEDYGVRISDGPLKGLCARAVVVLDENDQIIHHELVPEITQEPDYESALKAVGA